MGVNFVEILIKRTVVPRTIIDTPTVGLIVETSSPDRL